MSRERIAISSCALPGRSVAEIETLALQQDWLIEFSSGFKAAPDLAEQFRRARCRKLIHNYFPPPMTPFVLNLASVDSGIWQQSIDHGKRALQLAADCGVPFYSVHAGYGIDPKPSHLGRPIPVGTPVAREIYWNAFIRAVEVLLKEGDRLGVDLYIENNVIIAENRHVPLLCTTPEETQRLMNDLRHPRLGILLDTGHAKVSSQTLGFLPEGFVNLLGPDIKAIHHNENDGLKDTNLPMDSDYWFTPFMNRYANAWHVIEVLNLTPDVINSQISRLENAMKARSSTC